MEPAHRAVILTEPAACMRHRWGAGSVVGGRTQHSPGSEDSRLHRQVIAQPASPMLVFRGKRRSREGLQESCSELSIHKVMVKGRLSMPFSSPAPFISKAS